MQCCEKRGANVALRQVGPNTKLVLSVHLKCRGTLTSCFAKAVRANYGMRIRLPRIDLDIDFGLC